MNTILIILFTDYVNDEKLKFICGWWLMEFIFLNFIIGFFIPFIIANKQIVKEIQIWCYKRKIKKNRKIQISKKVKN